MTLFVCFMMLVGVPGQSQPPGTPPGSGPSTGAPSTGVQRQPGTPETSPPIGLGGTHDPCIIREGNTWWLFSTGVGIKVQRSNNLVDWQPAGKVFQSPPAWAMRMVPGYKGHTWAPDVQFFDGEYHLYYSVSTFGSNRSAIGHATTPTLDPDNPKHKWLDHGLLIHSEKRQNYNCIDANLCLDEKGKPWLSFGSFWSGLKICALDSEAGRPIEGPIYDIASRPGQGAIEAPWIHRKGEYYYLFCSYDNCCKGIKSDYRIMVGRSKKIMGPYVDKIGKPMTEGGASEILAGKGDVHGPGHNCLFESAGKTYLGYHFYDGANKGKPTLQVREIDWKDGWPEAGRVLTQPGIPAAK